MHAPSGGHLHGEDFPSSLESPEASRPAYSRQMIQDCPNPYQSLLSPSQILVETWGTCPDANIWMCNLSCHWPEEMVQPRRQEGRRTWKCL